MQKRIIHRIIFLVLTVLVIPLVPILIIFVGVSSPEYVIKGTLNIDLSHTQTPSYLEVYTTFLKNILRLNLGTSAATGKPVISIVFSGMLKSLVIIVPSILFSYAAGIVIAIWIKKYRSAMAIWNKLYVVFYIPMIVFSYLLLYSLSSLGLPIPSKAGYAAAALVLSIYPVYVISNSLRKTLTDLENSNFFLFHQSLGFTKDTIWRRFGKKMILVGFLSYFENILIYMLGFLYFIEAPFGIDGMGYRFVFSVRRFDYPVIIGFCIVCIVLLSMVGLVVDALKLRLDPRQVYA
jgi:peptide/nickel transport system permease protein